MSDKKQFADITGRASARGGCTQCADDQDQEQSKDVEPEIVRMAILVGAAGWSVVDIVAGIASVEFGEEEGCWNLGPEGICGCC